MATVIVLEAMLPSDWDSVRAIYLDGIASGQATFETEAPPWEQWDAAHHPFARLVARRNGQVVGWAALSPVSRRACYAGVAEVSVYVAAGERGQGVGHQLLEAVIKEAEQHGIWTLQGATFAGNEASLRLQRRCSFREIGRRERIAHLRGEWRDTVLTERRSCVIAADSKPRGDHVVNFYDSLAPFYHLIFPDWEASIRRQADALNGIIRERWGETPLSVLDVACGIGTQSLGLAMLGHRVTASDLSAGAVERARREAESRGLAIRFSVADMRQAAAHHREQFDLVIACDNSVPHLLTDADLLAAFRQFLACTRPGGGCLISVRDYDREERTGVQVKLYGIRDEVGSRYLVWQVWEYHGSVYDLSMYFVEDRGAAGCTTQVMRSRYYAIGMDRLANLMTQAGFVQVERLDGRFYQPILLGRRG